MDENTKLKIQKEIELFTSIKEFLNQNSKFSSLSLSNFQTILVGYFTACLAVLFIWILATAKRKFKKKGKCCLNLLRKCCMNCLKKCCMRCLRRVGTL